MTTVVYLILAALVGIGVAALFTAVEEFPEVDSVGFEDVDEHEEMTK